jgi:hypothetical protein
MVPDTYAATTATAGFVSVFGVIVCGIYLVGILIGLAMLVFWIWMLIDVIQRTPSQFGDSSDDNTKLLWIVILLLTSWIGALIYYFMVYKKYPRS